jgi:hypothetical protein
MATQTIRNGESIRLNLLPGESLGVGAASGTYNASIVQGEGVGVIAAGEIRGTYGPYPSGVGIQLTANASSVIDFDAGVAPVRETGNNIEFGRPAFNKMLKIVDGSGAWTSDNATVAVSNIGATFVNPTARNVQFASADFTPNNATARVSLSGLTVFSLESTITLAISVSDFPATGGFLGIHFSSDNFATKSIGYSWTWSNAYRPNGVIYLTVGLSETGAGNYGGIGSPTNSVVFVGGQLTTDVMTDVRVSLNGLSGKTVKLLGIFTGRPSKKGRVIFGVDDGRLSQYSLLYPMCIANNVPLTIALPHGLVGVANYITTQQANEMYSSGMVDFVGHSRNHSNLTTITVAAARQQMRENAVYLQDNYPRGSACMAYPVNAYNPAVLQAASDAGFSYARSINRAFISASAHGMDDKMSMGGVTVSSSTLADAKLKVDAAANTGQVLWLYGHNILPVNNPGGLGGPPPSVSTDWYQDDMAELVRYIATHNGIDAVSWSDFQRLVEDIQPTLV